MYANVDSELSPRGHCMVNHTSSMLGVMGFGASAASPAPKAHLLENFAHFQTSRKTGTCTRFQSRM